MLRRVGVSWVVREGSHCDRAPARLDADMARVLRWAALVVLLSLPLILYLGRSANQPCEFPPGTPRTPCDPIAVGPNWLGPLFFTALALTILQLLLSVVAGLGDDDTRSRPN
jgi:hypothetical protein